MGLEIITIIPARGGSKGIPNKNLKLLVAKPLISYTIKQSKSSRFVKRTFVSTDKIHRKNTGRKLLSVRQGWQEIGQLANQRLNMLLNTCKKKKITLPISLFFYSALHL